MWRKYSGVNGGLPYLEPYVYHKDMPSDCGDSFANNGQSYRYTVKRNTWYKVFLKVKMNTGYDFNGAIEMKVNNNVVYSNQNFRWATTSTGRKIDQLLWGIFRGGNKDEYKSSTDNYIRINDVKINKL